MKTRGHKRTREGSTSQDQPPGVFLDTAQNDDSNNGEPNAPPTTASRPRVSTKRSRPSSNVPTPAPSRDLPAANDTTSLCSDSAEPAAPQELPSEQSGRTTRSQNKFRRPALDIGLDWQAAQREREAALAAKAEKKAERSRKDADKLERSHRREAGLARIGALEDERERRDREEDSDKYLNTGSTARRGYLASSKASGTQQPSSRAEERVESDGSGSKFSEDNGETSDNSGDEEDDEMGLTRKSAGPPKKRKTKAQLKRDKRIRLHEEIDAAKGPATKATVQPGGRGKKRLSEEAYAGALGPTGAFPKPLSPLDLSTTGDIVDAFRPAYKTKLLAQVTRACSSAAPESSSNPATPAKKPAVRRAPSSSSTAKLNTPRFHMAGTPAPATRPLQPPEPPSENEDEIGGLDDDDVAVSRESVTRGTIGRSFQSLKVTYVQPQPLAKAKAKRTPKANMDPTQSLSAELLPEWIRDTFKTILMPTLLDHYGAARDPWTLEAKTLTWSKRSAKPEPTTNAEKPRYLIDVLQEMVDSLYPREFQKLEQTDLLIRVARQRILNWRRAFYERATKVVKAGYQEFKLKHPKATKADIKTWAIKAVDPDTGLAFWETLPTCEDPMAHGNLQSVYVLTTFAPHINAVADSHFEDHQPPISALSLALAAVDFAFSAYRTGEYVAPKDKFDQEGVGKISDWYLKDAVLPALKKSDRGGLYMLTALAAAVDPWGNLTQDVSWILLDMSPTSLEVRVMQVQYCSIH
ncbi:hypothetical protein LXA43DRAFT_1102646 [Ganoderma leucocontextum]|nr:hypothetical protein LXA43DRAFT_1102646 [Ganoderma leucocontextum]